MSKSNKNQKSITSFFKNPGQSTSNEPSGSKSKPSPTVEIKKEVEEEAPKLPASPLLTKPVNSPKKPTVITTPTVTHQRQPTHETEWINLSDRFLLGNRSFDVQYAHLYAERLGSMRKMMIKAAENHWSLLFITLNN
jgi:hypothetical protein